MNPTKSRSLVVVSILLLLIGVGIVFFGFIIPKVKEAQKLRGERHALGVVVKEEAETIKAVQVLLDKYINIPQLQDSLSLSLPTEERVPSIVNQIQGIAGLSGVVIESINLRTLPIEPTRGKSLIKAVGTIEITVKAQSSYESLKQYIEGIETNMRIMDIRSIRASDEDGGGVLSYTMVVNTYYQR